MRRRLLLGGVLVLALVGVSDPVTAQPPPKKDDKAPAKPGPGDAALNEGYRRFFKRPETVAEAWDAMKFEMEVGRYDLAGLHLRTLLSKNPTDEQLLAIEEKEGTPAFLRLLNVPPESWGPDPAYQKECRDNVAKLVKLVSDALAKKLKDGKRLAQLVEALNKSPEEKEYALKELLRYRAAAVPPIIDALRTAKAGDRYPLLQALELLGPDVVPPMLAALDSGDAILQLELLDVLKKKAAKEAVPHLWYVIGSPTSAESVRRRAAEVQGYLTETPPSALPPATRMLVREAEKYYKHEVKFPDPPNVRVWRWDGKGVVLGWPGAEAVPATKAEEYWGMKFAGQALRLDPSNEAAQTLLLSLILDKAMEQAGVEQPLARGVPAAHDLLATVNPDLIGLVLERGLREQKTPVVLAAVRALGDVADVRAARDTARGPSALRKALDYPDARVQFAAADSLARIPADPGPAAAGRVVEILGRALAGTPEMGRANTKILVASASDPWKAEVGRNLAAAGFEPVPVASGRDLMRRLTAASDIGGIVLESNLPDPGFVFLLGQLKADVHARRLPVLVTAVPETAEAGDLARRYATEKNKLADLTKRTQGLREYRQNLQAEFAAEKARIEKSADPPQAKERRLEDLNVQLVKATDDLLRARPEQARLDLAAQEVERGLQAMAVRYDGEVRRREDAIRRLAADMPNVQVVTTAYLEDAKQVQDRLNGGGVADKTPLSAAERKGQAERAIQYLARMAHGDLAGYDVRPAADAVYAALRPGVLSPQGQVAAIAVVVTLPTAKPQAELLSAVLDEKNGKDVRAIAAGALLRHVQTHGVALNPVQADAVRALHDKPGLDAEVKLAVAPLVGALRRDGRATGERLLQFQPPPPGAPPAPVPMPMPKEKGQP